MKDKVVCISGTRSLQPKVSGPLIEFMWSESGISWPPKKIIAGEASGVDDAAQQFAKKYGIPFEEYRADWNTHGRSAGPLRNERMAKEADVTLAIRLDSSKGTSDMIERAKKHNHHLYVLDMWTNETPPTHT
jgi:hypothetical protein